MVKKIFRKIEEHIALPVSNILQYYLVLVQVSKTKKVFGLVLSILIYSCYHTEASTDAVFALKLLLLGCFLCFKLFKAELSICLL